MKKLMALFVLSLMLLPSQKLMAQDGQPTSRKGWGKNCGYCQMYNNGNLVEINGEIQEISKFYPQKGMSYGVELILQTKDGERIIHVAPNWYLEKQEIVFKVGEQIEVEGAEVDFNGREVIMAQDIERGDDSIKLRDEKGRPAWWK